MEERAYESDKKAAFTLLELLVVMAVMAILAGLLLPTLARTKARAQSVQCLNNLRQVSLSFRLWADDHGGNYPTHVMGCDGGPVMIVTNSTISSAPTKNQPVMYRVFQALSNELATPKVLCCPSEKLHGASKNWAEPHAGDFCMKSVSYLLGVDTVEAAPKMLLSGDGLLSPEDDEYVYYYATLIPQYLEVWDHVYWNRKYGHKGFGNVTLGDGSAHRLSTPRLKEFLSHTGDPRNMLVLPWPVP